MDKDPRTLVVLGATGDIGSELCHRLARDSVVPAPAARDGTRLTDLAEELEAPFQPEDGVAYMLGPEPGWIAEQTVGVDGSLSTLPPPARRPAKA